MLTKKVTLRITTTDEIEYTEERTISASVLDDAFAMMNYVRLQIEADPNIASIQFIYTDEQEKFNN